MAAKARFPLTDQSPSSIAPPQRYVAVTAASTDLAYPSGSGIYPRVLYIGSGGNVTLMDLDGNETQFVAVPTGAELIGYFQQITAASAGSMVAKW